MHPKIKFNLLCLPFMRQRIGGRWYAFLAWGRMGWLAFHPKLTKYPTLGRIINMGWNNNNNNIIIIIINNNNNNHKLETTQ